MIQAVHVLEDFHHVGRRDLLEVCRRYDVDLGRRVLDKGARQRAGDDNSIELDGTFLQCKIDAQHLSFDKSCAHFAGAITHGGSGKRVLAGGDSAHNECTFDIGLGAVCRAFDANNSEGYGPAVSIDLAFDDGFGAQSGGGQQEEERY